MKDIPKKLKQNSTIIFSVILGYIKTIKFIVQHFAQKNNISHEVYHQGCLQNISTNTQITSDSHTFTKAILDGKLQNLQNFL